MLENTWANFVWRSNAIFLSIFITIAIVTSIKKHIIEHWIILPIMIASRHLPQCCSSVVIIVCSLLGNLFPPPPFAVSTIWCYDFHAASIVTNAVEVAALLNLMMVVTGFTHTFHIWFISVKLRKGRPGASLPFHSRHLSASGGRRRRWRILEWSILYMSWEI